MAMRTQPSLGRRMRSSDGLLPGTGFRDDDPVEALSAAASLSFLRSPDGQWLSRPVRPKWVDEAPWSDDPVVMAVVDTGVCDDYPPLADRILEQVDLTGEGLRDEEGHGSAVTAVLLAYSSPTTRVISVKALDRKKVATIGRLSLGMRKAAELLSGRGQIINVSAGRRTPDCVGDCPLCTTVTQLQDEGFLVVAAAGNTVGMTYCPARVAISVSTTDPDAADGDVKFELPEWEGLEG